MGVKTAGVGHFAIPTAPAAGTSVTSGAANAFSAAYVQLIASTAAALYITGIFVEEAAATAGTYIAVRLAVGAAAAESIVGEYLIAPQTGSTVTRSYHPIYPPIPVAAAQRIAAKTADSVGAQAKLITLECIAQSNVVDDGIAVGTVTTLTNLPAITANWLTAAGIAAGAITNAKFAAGAIDAAAVAADAIGASELAADAATEIGTAVWAAAARTLTSGAGIVLAKGVGVTGFNDILAADVWAVVARTLTANPGLDGAGIRAAIGMAAANFDTQINALAGYVDTEVATILADTATLVARLTLARAVLLDNLSALPTIQAKTDQLTFTFANKLDCHVMRVNNVEVIGTGAVGDRFRAFGT